MGQGEASGSEPESRRISTPPVSSAGRGQASIRMLLSLVTVGAVLALAGLGVLAWRSVDLSNEVNAVRVALTSTTTTTKVRPATTTTLDPWQGGYDDYRAKVNSFLSAHSGLYDMNRSVSGNLGKTHAKAIASDIDDLVLSLRYFPPSPANVQKAHDAYLDGLMRLYVAATIVSQNDSSSNVDDYTGAWAQEDMLFLAWISEFAHSRQ